ncbi:hypothetical protein OSB04_031058 [Centaurea solstitialis]|uniref:CCHC-type domain-containing protein n=1 Tax=Centaurea solstitialis TaxID=347529 RepID=A0AA38W4D8_9ASTR|nr:hypothetical protein OSB04_031058 [Centaurea solstitialis]
MASSSQTTLQQQLAAAQEQIQWLNEQNLQMNGELSRLRASNPQTSHIPVSIHQQRPFFPQNPPPVSQPPFVQPQMSQSFIPPQVSQVNLPPPPQISQVSLPPPPPVNNSRPIFPPLPSGTSSNPPPNDIVDIRLKMLEEQNKAMLALLTKLPGAAVPIEVEPKTGFQASPYIDEIALVDIPKKYNIPAFTPKYSGISDPVEHIAQYKQLVWTVPIPTQFQEICMCKGFGSTLTGAALQWLINLKPKSIASWSELVNQFTRQFASSRKMEKQTSDLYYVVQKTGETIREYFNRFNAEMIEVKNCDVRTAIEAYKRGLDTSSELYTDLTKYPPENFDDVRARTLAHMRIEDDALFRRKHSNDKKNLGAQKHDFKPKRVNKIDNSRRDQNKRPNQGKGKVRYPDLSTYHFAGTAKDLVDSLRNLEVNVRWPKKPESPSKDRDQTKWCDFHTDHGHNTDDCISLKKEIAYLKSNGHLKNPLGDDSKRPTSPVPTKVVNCITGGSEVCGLTYSAAKRHAREGPEGHPIPNESRTAEDKELDATKISFDIEDMSDTHQKHHDALVIQLTIGNCLTKRVLIDGGSSANVIFAETLKIMGIDRSNIVRRTTTLIGFNGDATSTLGEVILPVFAKGINKQTKFNVINCPSAYNAILGRPWIHDMKAVPSTYHQKIKFPSSNYRARMEYDHCFAWSHEDMVGIDPNIISHKLNVDPTFKPVKQKRRKFAPERNKVINEEVDNLLKTGKIREVKYPDWLANVVVVQKKNGKWRVCIDFTDLNKACPKDPFPLPHIDAMVDATAGHELLTFMDAYSGYNQILMHKDDQEKTAFMTDKGIYCYKVMPFGLKNAGSTYQRLVNRMFKDHLGRTMEIVTSELFNDERIWFKRSFLSSMDDGYASSTNNLSLRSILEKDKLTGPNFLDWERNLMIVLRHERKWYVLEEPLGEAPPANAPATARNAHKKHSDDLLDVACLMLATMSPDLQAGLINTNAYDMIRQLRDMFQTQARTERYDATKAFNECKMVKGTSVSDHIMNMKRHLDHLERLGHPVPLQLATDTILNSLSEDYRPFVVNYNMNNMEKSIAELHSMLKTAELNLGNKNKTKDVLMVRDGGVKKKNGHASTNKGKGPVQAVQSAPKKGKGKGKGKKVKPNKARTENRCFTCNEVGHWRQNCPKRHEAGSYDQLLNNSYKRCRLKVAQIFDRVANIGRDPRLRLLLGISHKKNLKTRKKPAVDLGSSRHSTMYHQLGVTSEDYSCVSYDTAKYKKYSNELRQLRAELEKKDVVALSKSRLWKKRGKVGSCLILAVDGYGSELYTTNQE